MPDGPGRQGAPSVAPGPQKPHMPLLELGGPELLQNGSAEVGNDLLLGKLAVSLGRLGREAIGVIQPSTQVLGQRDLRRVDSGAVVDLGEQSDHLGLRRLLGSARTVTDRVRRLPVAGSRSPASNFSRQLFLPRRVMLPGIVDAPLLENIAEAIANGLEAVSVHAERGIEDRRKDAISDGLAEVVNHAAKLVGNLSNAVHERVRTRTRLAGRPERREYFSHRFGRLHEGPRVVHPVLVHRRRMRMREEICFPDAPAQQHQKAGGLPAVVGIEKLRQKIFVIE